MSGFIQVKRVISEHPFDVQQALVNVNDIGTVTDAGRGLSRMRVRGMNDFHEWTIAHDVDEMSQMISKASSEFR